MKLSEASLKEWVNYSLTQQELAAKLTMAGLEVESVTPAAEKFSGVIVGEIISTARHPDAEKLTICTVKIPDKILTVVCGASNVKPGMKVALAVDGAQLSKEKIIKSGQIRGVASEGMLCSAQELGLAKESSEILELSSDAPLGEDIFDYFQLQDFIWDISITPNRGDCLSLKGIAREIAAINNTTLLKNAASKIPATISDILPISISEKKFCPNYVGRIIKNINSKAATPIKIKETLRRSGIRSINIIVDIVNYTMIQIGQPMHAFDLKCIEAGIEVRFSKREEIALLDGTEKILDDETLIIADSKKPLAIAGIMGGINSSVTLATVDIFLESAYFAAESIAKKRQFYSLTSDSAYRYERGIDPTIQEEAIEFATQLILEFAGGNPGPTTSETAYDFLPQRKEIILTAEKLRKVLGFSIPEEQVAAIFKSLNFICNFESQLMQWKIVAPAYRFDINLPEDLIEEVARMYGYHHIPVLPLSGDLFTNKEIVQETDWLRLRNLLVDQGLHEVVTYSFIDQDLHEKLCDNAAARHLLNPISSEMSIMRTSLWPGLIKTLQFNESRQQNTVQIFEIGNCFVVDGEEILQVTKLAGLISGPIHQETWSSKQSPADFYDAKGIIENIFHAQGSLGFEATQHVALHPGQSAEFYLEGSSDKIGILGALHPRLQDALGLKTPCYLFELDLNKYIHPKNVQNIEISKFPEIRRDIAIVINEAVPAGKIQDTIKVLAGDWLKEVFIFDVYQGKGISPGHKSIALALILQHPTRTLVDDEVNSMMNHIIETLTVQLGAELRS